MTHSIMQWIGSPNSNKFIYSTDIKTKHKENFIKVSNISFIEKSGFSMFSPGTMKNITCVYVIFNKFNKIACFTNRESIYIYIR